MSSSTKFPSGLNNWAGSDKPTRLDFVADNEILDQNAMWKDSYDLDGDVAQAGGISEFALAKSVYDPTGEVAQAGGVAVAIENAVSANEGYTVCTHSKSGTVHTLTGCAGSNIKFTATADYSDGDTFLVVDTSNNSDACTAQTSDGKPIAGKCFAEGAVVVCYRIGNVLNFKTGGTGLNYNIVVSAVRPSTAYENTLWVQSSIPLNRYAVASVRPSYLNQTGDLHIKIGNSNTSFNALVNNAIIMTPQLAVQRNSAGQWITCPLEYYNGTQWQTVSSTLWLLDGAETFNDVTGGWATYMTGNSWYNYYDLGLGRVPNPYEFYAGGGDSNKIADKITTLPIDLTGVRFLTLDCTGHERFGGGAIGTPQNFVYISSAANGNHANNVVAYTKTTYNGRHEITLNVTNYNGLYYVGAGMTQSGSATNGIHIWRIWGTY